MDAAILALIRATDRYAEALRDAGPPQPFSAEDREALADEVARGLLTLANEPPD